MPAQKLTSRAPHSEIEYVLCRRQCALNEEGKMTICTASAMMAIIIAVRKREPGELATVSEVTANCSSTYSKRGSRGRGRFDFFVNSVRAGAGYSPVFVAVPGQARVRA